jgi:hypothetical protein
MSKQHYQVATFKARSSIGYLVKRSHSLMLDIMEPVLEAHGFSFVQYVILAWLREGIAVNPRDICAQFRHNSGAMTRVVDQLCERGLNEALGDFNAHEFEELQRLLIKLNNTLQSAVEPAAVAAEA